MTQITYPTKIRRAKRSLYLTLVCIRGRARRDSLHFSRYLASRAEAQLDPDGLDGEIGRQRREWESRIRN
jgi:hypothetical protein